MADARTTKTDEAVRNALLELLGDKRLPDITMAELARHAHVSRSTLYAHYDNVYSLFRTLVAEFVAGLRTLNTQLKCSDCKGATPKRPFCMALRAAGPWQPLVLAPEFLPTYIDVILEGDGLEGALEPYLETGVTREQARALLVFQMTGCYTTATMLDDIVWESNQCAIDQFIRGGFAALRQL